MTERQAVTAQPWLRRMGPRDPAESHRAATPLELFYDLCFVVAVGANSKSLEHALAEGHYASGVLSFLLVFFAIWWAWMNYSWFASAYDPDDAPYRVATMVIMAGVLILAAGVPSAFDDRAFGLVFLGYLVMRVGLESQRLRAARSDPARRATLLRYAAGETFCMVLWALAIFVVPRAWMVPVWLLAAACELMVPPWAERLVSIPWHPHHIAERYGLFTIIVLGESILSAANTIRDGIGDAHVTDLALVAAGGLVTVFGMWWVYFSLSSAGLLEGRRMAVLWGYGHYVIFASGAAVGAGIAVNAAKATGHAHVSTMAAGFAVAVPVFLYLLVVWWLVVRPHGPNAPFAWAMPLIGLLALAACFTGAPLPVIGLLMAAQVGLSILAHGTKGARAAADYDLEP
ncbi:low temperature requirement protein A [Spirillospora sp. NPDC047279]|uniref:low temperature requirement protein A n=1 Tax=Spirillospora sp. NPDC047279 TaxID=3155478 RepID=UPI0033EF71A2